jgi:pimeloyl-ACP methyl ester carboxylesterase
VQEDDRMTARLRRVTSSDGVTLAVYEHGDPTAPTVVAVHGYPDNHSVWDGVVELLADRFHVVTYDVRGAGASDKPPVRSAYRIPRLTDDLAAVLDAVSPGEAVHLLAHDWGSIQAWPGLTGERLAGRIATFTSISGPSLEYSGLWLRRVRDHPRLSLRQFAHSYYVALFQLPALPEFVMRKGLADRRLKTAGQTHSGRRVDDKVNGIMLYRANLFGSMGRPRPQKVLIPVQLIAPERDAFVTPELAIGTAEQWVPDLTIHRIDGSHWVVSEEPEVVAGLTADFINSHLEAGVRR